MSKPATVKNRSAVSQVAIALAAELDAAGKKIDLSEYLGDSVSQFTKKEQSIMTRALVYAQRKHEGQTRASGEPYVTHVIAAALKVIEMGLDHATICGALLHDTVEDTDATFEELQSLFPDPIPELVMGVTKISSLNFRSQHEEQVQNLRKMVIAMAKDIRVVLIKLADRWHNMETLEYLSESKQRRISRTTLDIYAPLAGRLGMYIIKSNLEDLAMRYIYPREYNEMRKNIAAKKTDREKHIQKSIAYLSKEIKKQNLEAEVSGRSKHFWSIFQKMRTQNLTFEEIYDLNALRVICKTRSDCYQILGIIHSIWKPVPEHFADFIAMAKPNMYQSIHTKVMGLDGQMTEVQLRTEEMHRVAEQGIAAHWIYKGDKAMGGVEKQLVWLRQMVEWVQDADDPSELLQELKSDTLQQKVFCFTPKGDVIEMALGATVLDFAYRIHTELGHRCTGAKINQKFVPLRTKLRMGDLVELVTTKTPHPSPDWLRIAQTSRTRAKIRHALKARDYQTHVDTGREMILKALVKAGIRVSPSELKDVIDLHLQHLHAKTVNDVLADVGFGTLPSSMVVGRFLPTQDQVRRPRKKSRKSEDPNEVLIDGQSGGLTRFAQCCNPQPGDPIAGFVTRGRGVSIHQSSCPHLLHWTMQSHEQRSRLISVSWATEDIKTQSVGLRVTFDDRMGILSELTRVIAALNIGITQSHSKSNIRSHRATARFTITVQDDMELNHVMQKLRDVSGVDTVTRDSKYR